MKFKFLFLALLLIPISIQSSSFSGGGGPTCSGITDGHVYTAQADGSCGFEAAPGAAGGDSWSDPVDSDIIPDTDDTYDIGSSTAQFKDGWFDGALEADAITLGGASVMTGASTHTLTNKTFDADGSGNSITNIENADVKAAAAIALNKLAATTASRALVSDASGFVSASAVTSTQLAGLLVEDISGHVVALADQDYVLRINGSYGYTVNSISTKCASGNASGNLTIDGVNVTGCGTAGINLTNVEDTDSCTANNSASAGNDLVLTISGNSSGANCRFTVKTTRS